MKYLWNIFKQHWQHEFNVKKFVAVFLFASLLTYLNTAHGLIKPQITALPNIWRIIPYFFLFSGVYLISAFIACKEIKHKKEFLLFVGICFLINAFDSSYYLVSVVRNLQFSSPEWHSAIVGLSKDLVSIVTIVFPMIIFALLTKNKLQLNGFFGLQFRKDFSLKPYFIILGMMSVLIAISVFTNGISSYYPLLKRSPIVQYADILGLSKPLAVFIFEAIYASDFISVELFFRGMLIFVFTRYLGSQVILPMAACYMIFHFGKPLMEVFSSFFGGYLLGVLALHTRNIWGGVIVHIGIALLMELFASIISN